VKADFDATWRDDGARQCLLRDAAPDGKASGIRRRKPAGGRAAWMVVIVATVREVANR